MEEKYKRADTVPGIRSFHQLITISDSIISVKYVPDDQYYTIQHFKNQIELLL